MCCIFGVPMAALSDISVAYAWVHRGLIGKNVTEITPNGDFVFQLISVTTFRLSRTYACNYSTT